MKIIFIICFFILTINVYSQKWYEKLPFDDPKIIELYHYDEFLGEEQGGFFEKISARILELGQDKSINLYDLKTNKQAEIVGFYAGRVALIFQETGKEELLIHTFKDIGWFGKGDREITWELAQCKDPAAAVLLEMFARKRILELAPLMDEYCRLTSYEPLPSPNETELRLSTLKHALEWMMQSENPQIRIIVKKMSNLIQEKWRNRIGVGLVKYLNENEDHFRKLRGKRSTDGH